jgi:hypothetical protein
MHLALCSEYEEEILNWITTKSDNNNNHITRTHLLNYVTEHYHGSFSRCWANLFVGRHLDRLAETYSTPQEDSRLSVPRIFLDATINCLSEHVHDQPAELVYNLDEVGRGEWGDATTKKVIVPISRKNQILHHKIQRNMKHLSILTCVSPTGSYCPPYIVTAQPIPPAVLQSGLRNGTDVVFHQNRKPYIDKESCLDFLNSVFIPTLKETRLKNNLQNSDAVLLMDNCTAHTFSTAINLLTEHRVKIITFAPHTTNVFQMLDFSFFGVLKKRSQIFFHATY